MLLKQRRLLGLQYAMSGCRTLSRSIAMPKFAANLSMMFTEHDFLDRFEAAANAGFDAVEFLLMSLMREM